MGWALDELIEEDFNASEKPLVSFILRLQNDFPEEYDSFLGTNPYMYLSKQGWTAERFKAAGIKPMYWVY